MRKLLSLALLMTCATMLQAQTVLFRESFDPPSNADSVTAAGASSNWAINSRLYYSGTQCDSNLVSVNDTAYLTTGPFNTVGYPYVFLTFSHICKIEILDAGEIEVSVNGGAWTKLTATEYVSPGNSQFVASGNKFNSNAYPMDWSPTLNAVKPEQSWWKNEQFNISGLVANSTNVRVRFLLRDGNGNGAGFNHGWYIDNIRILGSTSELNPPTIHLKTPIIQDTVFNNGPFDIWAYIQDPSGISNAKIFYKVNNGTWLNVPMTLISDSTYKGTIPSYTYNTRIDYYVSATDNSSSYNTGTTGNYWLYIKQAPATVIVGTGTTTSYYAPFYNSGTTSTFRYSNHIDLFTPSDLTPGVLTSIAWNKANTMGYAFPDATVKVYLKHTNATTVPTTSGTFATELTGATLVYQNTALSFPATTGWMDFIFNMSNFTYNGTQNLMVLVYYYHPQGSDAFTWYYTSVSNMAYTWAAATDPPASGYGAGYRSNTRFGYQPTSYQYDAGITQINEPTGTVLASTPLDVKVSMKNFGSATLNTVVMKWALDGVYQDSVVWNGTSDPGVVTLPYTLDNATFSLGSHTIKAWTSRPNGQADQNPLNDTAYVTFYVCSNILSGNYTIGPSGDFASFGAAVTAMTNCGISGPVVFNVAPGTYKEMVTLNPVTGSSPVNTVTFQSASGNPNDVILKYDSLNSTVASVVRLLGADNIRIKNITIQSAGSLGYGRLISVRDGACNNIIDGNILTGPVTTLTTDVHSLIHSAGSLTTLDTGNLIQNNTLYNGTFGIYWYGQGTAINQLEPGNKFLNNTLINQYYRGMVIYYQNAPQVNKNIISTNTAYTSYYGLQTAYCDNGLQVLKNKLTLSTGGYGMYIYYCDGAVGNEGLIANNMISISGTNTSYGLYPYYSSNQKIYHNSVNLSTNTATARAFYLGGSSSYVNNYVKNNIFAYTGSNTAGVAAYVSSAVSIAHMDYNDLFSTGTNLGYWTANQATLAAWKTASQKDTNSVSVNPGFVTPTNLHTFLPALYQMGTPLGPVQDDIDDDVRNVPPCIGADEFILLTKDLAIDSILSPVKSCSLTGAEQIKIRVKNLGTDPVTNAQFTYIKNNGTPVTEAWSGNLAQNASMIFTFAATENLAAYGNYSFKFYVNQSGEQNFGNDTISNYNIYNGWDFYSSAYTQGFEPTDVYSDWSRLDVNNDGRTWEFPYSSTTYSHSGSYSARFYNGTTNPGNDWLFSRCFPFQAGETYQIEFWYRVESATYPQNITLYYGNSATPAAMTNTLVTLAGVTNTTHVKATATFSPATSGSYYFGWWATSAAANYYAFIDDINIKVLPGQEAAMLGIVSPSDGCGLGSEPIKIKIKNTGANQINGNLMASYRANGGSVVTESVTNSINSGDTLTFTFTTPLNMAVTTHDSTFNIKSWVSLTGDPIQSNDTTFRSVESLHVPVAPVVVDDTVFYGNAATLAAISPDNVFWYVNDTTAAYFHQGATYTTPVLFDTTTYYVEARQGAPAMYVGPYDYSIGTSSTYANTTYYLYFDVLTPSGITIQSIDVFPSTAPGAAYAIQLLDNAGTVLQTYNGTTTVASGARETAPVNFSVPYGTNYRIKFGVSSGFYRNTTGATYPYVIPNVISINGNSFSGYPQYYYFFYNWKIGSDGCSSPRVPVTANVILPSADIAVEEIITPVDGCTFGSEPVTAKFVNYGADTINTPFTAGFLVSGNPLPVTETLNYILLPGDSVVHTFATPASTPVLTGDSVYAIKVFGNVSGDIYHVNDSLAKNVTLKFSPPDPSVLNDTIPYGTAATLSAFSSYPLEWYDVPSGGTMIDTGYYYTTPLLYGNSTYYVQARDGSSSAGGLKITEINIGTNDMIEIQNVSSSTINATGWVVAVSNTYGTINDVNPILWNLGVMPAGQVLVRNDISGDPNYWGNNLMWNPGPFPTYTGWAMIIDNLGNIVDYVAWGWPQADIQGFSATINSFPVTLGNKWNGGGVVDPASDFIVRMNSDTDAATDWSNLTTGSIGSANPGMTFGGAVAGGGCPSHRVPVTAVVGGMPPVDAGLITFTEPVSPTNLGIKNVKVILRNFGSNALQNVQIAWKVNGVSQVPFSWNGNLLTGETDTVQIGTYDFTYVPFPGLNNLVAWSQNPNSVVDPSNANDTISTVIDAHDPLNGIYYIRTANPDFMSFTETATVLNAWGVSGPVTIIADTGTYAEQVTFTEVPGASAVNTITFQSLTGINSDSRIEYGATGSSDNFVLLLNGADYFRFNNLTIKSVTASTYGRVVELRNGATNNIFEGNNIESIVTTSSSATPLYIYTTADHYNRFIGNNLKNGYYGAYIYGSSTVRKQGIQLIGNNITNWYYYGLYLYYNDSIRVIGNNFSNSSTGTTNYHIYSYYGDNNSRYERNRIHGTGSGSFYGIALLTGNSTATVPNWIVNNFISNSASSGTAYGIYLTGTNYTNVYYNSVNIGAGSATAGRAIYQTGGTTGINIKNNNFANTSGGYAYYIGTNAAIGVSNYNNLYSTGVVGYWGADRATLALLSAASGKDLNSKSVAPMFVSVSDLHTTQYLLNGAGNPIAGITTDIDGDTRHAVTPCIGADEFNPPPTDAGIIAITAPVSPATAGSQPVIVTLGNFGVDTLNNVMITYEVDGVVAGTYPWSGNLLSGGTVTGLNIGSVNLLAGSTVIRAWTSMPNGIMDTLNMNDTAQTSVIVCNGPMSGTYTIGGTNPDYYSFNDAVTALNVCGINGPVIFNVATGVYTEQVNLVPVTGASALNTITFQSASGLNTDVTLRYGANGSTNNYVVQLNGADYFSFKNMTLQSTTSNNYGRVVVFAATANFNRFEGNRIISVQTTSSTAAPVYSTGSNDSYNVFLNNEMKYGYYGVYFYGSSSAIKKFNVFEGNNITDWYYYGLYTYYNDSVQIIGNRLQNGTNATTNYHIYCGYSSKGARILKNRIFGSATGSFYGIYVYYCTSTAAEPLLVANNFVSETGGTGTAYGIYPYYSNYVNIYNNSVNVAGGSSSAGRALYQYYGSYINIVNNNLVNSGTGYAYYVNNPTAVQASDHNNLYSTGATLAYWGAAATNLGLLQGLSQKDSNSISADPVYVSLTDLHVNSAAVNAKGKSLALVSDDIDGDVRDANTPDIGADEFNPTPLDIATIDIVQPANMYSSVGTSVVVEVTYRNFGSDTITSFVAKYRYGNNAVVSQNWNGILLPSQTTNVVFTTPFVSLAGGLNLCAFATLAGDGDLSNDTLCSNYSGVPILSVPYSDDFEGINYFYTTGSLWEFGVPNASVINSAHSPTHAWATNLDGDYPANANDMLFTPYFNFSYAHNGKLEFYHWMHAEAANDGGNIQYSINNGTTWVTLGYIGDPAATNWYTATVNGKPCWNGQGTGWIYSTYNLATIPAIVNSATPVQFRFVFFSNASTHYNGWAVDDFAISAPPIAKDAGVIGFNSPIDSTTVGTPVTVSVVIKNFGTDSLQSVPVSYRVNNGAINSGVWTGTLNPGATTSYTFTTTFTSPATAYNLCAFTKKTGDTYKFNDTTCSTIFIKPAQNDAGVITVLSPDDSTTVNDSIAVTVRIRNFGTNVLTSVPVGYKLNGVQIAAETFTGSINPNDSATFTFYKKYASPYGNYSVCAYTLIAGDPDPSNNETCRYPLGVPAGIGSADMSGLELMQNIPNPASDYTLIPFVVPMPGNARIEISDLLGNIVTVIAEDVQTGRNHFRVDVKNIPAGVYFYTLNFESKRLTRRMVITK